jgi:3D (Asp-Asp-Asp) domain-containing protein
MTMVATAYDPGPASTGKSPGHPAYGITASGMRAGHGVVAVDPRVIPLGTRLYIPGYGNAIAGDTGGAIKGQRIDLGFATYNEAIRYGRQTVTVYVLD